MQVLLTGGETLDLESGLAAIGCTVTVARNRTEVERKIRSRRPDAVVLDLDATEDGLASIAEWRRSGIETHVLAVTSRVADTVSALNLGADAAATRPCPVPELLARFRAMLRLRREVTEPVARLFDLEIHHSARMVKRAGKEIHLTPREFRVLQFLAAHQGKVVGQSMILGILNQQITETRSNLVAVYIRYLRAKIDRGFDLPLILTVWRQGYMLRGNSQVEEAQSTRIPDFAASSRVLEFHPATSRRLASSLDFHQSAT